MEQALPSTLHPAEPPDDRVAEVLSPHGMQTDGDGAQDCKAHPLSWSLNYL